jgi:GNAT superfamily N-acetyltransferase
MNPGMLEKTKDSLLKKIRLKIRYGLTLQGIRNQLFKIGIEFSPYYLFQEGINVTEIPEIKGMDTDYSCELLKPEDMKTIGAINNAGFSEEKLLALLKTGELCLGIKHNNEIAAYMWVNFTELKYKSTTIHLKEDEAYLWMMYTREAYRGKNLAPYLRYKSYEMVKKMGRDKLYSVSDYFNSPAVAFKMKLNAKKLKLILFVQFLGKLYRSFIIKSHYSSN